MPKKIPLTLEELDHVLSWSIDDAARKTNYSRHFINSRVLSGRLSVVSTSPYRLDPDHVREQARLGFPEIKQTDAA